MMDDDQPNGVPGYCRLRCAADVVKSRRADAATIRRAVVGEELWVMEVDRGIAMIRENWRYAYVRADAFAFADATPPPIDRTKHAVIDVAHNDSFVPAHGGYGPSDYDVFHLDICFGSLLSIFVGVILLMMSGNYAPDTASKLILIGLGFCAVGLAATALSSFWRRYNYLIWWKKMIVWLPNLTSWAAWNAILLLVSAISFGLTGQAMGFGGAPGGSGGGSRSAVDEDGNVHQWDPWSGTWKPKPGVLGFGTEQGKREPGWFGDVPEKNAWGTQQRTRDGKDLYKKRE